MYKILIEVPQKTKRIQAWQINAFFIEKPLHMSQNRSFNGKMINSRTRKVYEYTKSRFDFITKNIFIFNIH